MNFLIILKKTKEIKKVKKIMRVNQKLHDTAFYKKWQSNIIKKAKEYGLDKYIVYRKINFNSKAEISLGYHPSPNVCKNTNGIIHNHIAIINLTEPYIFEQIFNLIRDYECNKIAGE